MFVCTVVSLLTVQSLISRGLASACVLFFCALVFVCTVVFLLTVQSFTGLCFSPWLVKVLAILLMCRARLRRVRTQASFSPGPVRQSRAMLKHL